MTRRVAARHDPSLAARIVARQPLHYAAGADAALDRPAHVRAGSSLEWVGDHLVVVQDDANFLALVDPRDARAHVAALPAGEGGLRQFDDERGNKHHKLDLEAVTTVPAGAGAPLVVAFGSGSSERRQTVVVVRRLTTSAIARAAVEVALHDASPLYAALRATPAFAGSELNVEAAVFLHDGDGERIRLFNRGNGAARGELRAVDATCDIAWPALVALLERGAPAPVPRRIVTYALGETDGHAFGFTDAAVLRTGEDGARWLLYTAAAEASPDATRDGPVAGSAMGVIRERGDDVAARWTSLLDEDGAPAREKVEGVAVDPADPARAWVVVDRDDPRLPSALCEVRLSGRWTE